MDERPSKSKQPHPQKSPATQPKASAGHAAEALAEPDHHYRALFIESREAMNLTIGGRIEDVNPAWLRLHGYCDRSEVLGKDIREVIHPEDRPKLAAWRATPNRNVSEFRQFRNLRKDGSVIEAEVYSSEMFLRGQRAVLTTVRDITEQKRAADKLRRSEANLAAAQRIAHVGSWEAELRSIEDFLQNPLWWSDETCRIFGYEPGTVEVTHEMFTRAILPAERDRVWAEVRAALHDHRPYSVEHRLLRPDGTERIVHEHAEVVYDPQTGRPVRFIGTVQDITERKRAEQSLRDREAELVEAQSVAHLGSYVLNIGEGRWTSSEALDQIFGIPAGFPKTVEGWAGLLHPDDRQQMQDYLLREVIQQKKFFDREYRIVRHRDGQVRWVHGLGRLQFDEDGKPKIMVGTIQDITERKQAEEAMRLLQFSVEHATDGVFWVGSDGRLLYTNEANCRRLGYSREELLKMTVSNINPDFPAERWATHWEETKRRGSVTIESRQHTKSGVFIPVEITINYVKFGGREVHFSFVRDITERLQAEEEHLRLTTAVTQAAEAILITDADGHILYVNPAFEKVTGYSRQEAQGQNPRILKSGKHDDAFYRQMWETLVRGDVWHGRITNKKKDGTFYEEEATISPIRDAAGRIVNYVGVKRDVTREAALEARFRQSQKMEAVGRLAGGIAHDFNNILTAILGYCSLAVQRVPPENPLHGYMTAVQESANRAAALTSQLLAFSRKQVLSPQPLDLNAVAGHMREMLCRLISENIQINFRLDPAIGNVKVDPGQLSQVIMNLAVNAGDAMPHGGTLTIATSHVEVDAARSRALVDVKPGRYVLLSVSDTGMGMDAEVKAHLFEPFYTTKQLSKGTGLGLATVYGIVTQSDGHIVVDSEPGRGTTFNVYLPHVEQAAEKIPAAATPRKIARGTETVLLAEDEPRVREMTRDILTSAGYTVLEAKGGAEALWMAKNHAGTIHLLLTDVVMPGLGGLELSKKLVGERPQLRVLYMSGYVESEVVPGQFLKPGVAFLQKPFSPAVLAAKVRELFDASPPAR